ncbi:hypothetical protein Agub_g2718, partial [Astrephomene gubernaculifera]
SLAMALQSISGSALDIRAIEPSLAGDDGGSDINADGDVSLAVTPRLTPPRPRDFGTPSPAAEAPSPASSATTYASANGESSADAAAATPASADVSGGSGGSSSPSTDASPASNSSWLEAPGRLPSDDDIAGYLAARNGGSALSPVGAVTLAFQSALAVLTQHFIALSRHSANETEARRAAERRADAAEALLGAAVTEERERRMRAEARAEAAEAMLLGAETRLAAAEEWMEATAGVVDDYHRAEETGLSSGSYSYGFEQQQYEKSAAASAGQGRMKEDEEEKLERQQEPLTGQQLYERFNEEDKVEREEVNEEEDGAWVYVPDCEPAAASLPPASASVAPAAAAAAAAVDAATSAAMSPANGVELVAEVAEAAAALAEQIPEESDEEAMEQEARYELWDVESTPSDEAVEEQVVTTEAPQPAQLQLQALLQQQPLPLALHSDDETDEGESVAEEVEELAASDDGDIDAAAEALMQLHLSSFEDFPAAAEAVSSGVTAQVEPALWFDEAPEVEEEKGQQAAEGGEEGLAAAAAVPFLHVIVPEEEAAKAGAAATAEKDGDEFSAMASADVSVNPVAAAAAVSEVTTADDEPVAEAAAAAPALTRSTFPAVAVPPHAVPEPVASASCSSPMASTASNTGSSNGGNATPAAASGVITSNNNDGSSSSSSSGGLAAQLEVMAALSFAGTGSREHEAESAAGFNPSQESADEIEDAVLAGGIRLPGGAVVLLRAGVTAAAAGRDQGSGGEEVTDETWRVRSQLGQRQEEDAESEGEATVNQLEEAVGTPPRHGNDHPGFAVPRDDNNSINNADFDGGSSSSPDAPYSAPPSGMRPDKMNYYTPWSMHSSNGSCGYHQDVGSCSGGGSGGSVGGDAGAGSTGACSRIVRDGVAGAVGVRYSPLRPNSLAQLRGEVTSTAEPVVTLVLDAEEDDEGSVVGEN